MRAINHAVTGALIGLTVGEPLIAVPLAVVSHFVCDVIPHYDGVDSRKAESSKQKWLRSRSFTYLLYTDAALCGLVVLALWLSRPQHWLLAATCAFAAATPDFSHLALYFQRNKKRLPKRTAFNRFATDIQWFQRPIGWVVEVAWFAGAVILLIPFLSE